MLLIPVALAIALAVNAPALLLAAIPFFIGLVQILYAIIFGKKFESQNGKTRPVTSQIESSRITALNSAATAEMLPAPLAAEQILIMPESSAANIAERSMPPSVTEYICESVVEKTDKQASW